MSKRYNVCAIGNALVDYEIEVSDAFLAENKIEKGLMTLVEEDRQFELIEAARGCIKTKQAGGSAANAIFALSQFGGTGYYTCKVANDPDGEVFVKDLERNGIDSNLNPSRLLEGITGKCLVMVSPDAERTMNTYLGVTTDFSVNELDEEAIKNAEYLYIEGYLVSSLTGMEAIKAAKKTAEDNGVKVSLSFSDPAMVKYFKNRMIEVVGSSVDLLFCNEEEAMLYTGKDAPDKAKEALKKSARQFVVTEGGKGATIYNGTSYIKVDPVPVKAVDTTGAGDMFAGAYLYGITNGESEETAGVLAGLSGSTVVGQFGPRLKNSRAKEILSQINRKDT